MEWKVINKGTKDIVDLLLKNRGILTKKAREEFFDPKHPKDLSLLKLKISKVQIEKATTRIKKAVKLGQEIIIFGDYDADGVSATAVLWEAVNALGGNVMPYIPDRFSEGYGLTAGAVDKLKKLNPKLKLIITVDNGIVAHGAVSVANKQGVDVIITDHHVKEKRYPTAHAIVHTTVTSGSAIAWVLARELGQVGGLDLVAIGTVADVLPLIGVNRSFVKYGLEELRKTSRTGLLKLFTEARIEREKIEAWHIGYMIGPRINAMGRLSHAMEALRLLCTNDEDRAESLALEMGRTNFKRQKKVADMLGHAEGLAAQKQWEGVILVGNEDYHEGVIGLAAARLTEMYYRPTIVMSVGEKIAKASARSIRGFNIIEAIRESSDMLEGHGGHAMAAGFSIKKERVEEFQIKLDKYAKSVLTKEVLTRKLKVDMELKFSQINGKLVGDLKKFEPTGMGNATGVFVTRELEVIEIKGVGKKNNHLKLVLKDGGKVLEAIGFGMGEYLVKIKKGQKIDVAYNIDENEWNGAVSLQLKLKDIKL